MLVSIIFCLISSILVYIFAENLMLIFVKESELEVIKVGVQLSKDRRCILHRNRNTLFMVWIL